MPLPPKIARAELREVQLGSTLDATREVNPEHNLKVQFNPQSLKVAFANQLQGGDQRGGAATQFVGKGSTKLSLELWFDVTVLKPDDPNATDDVRDLTKKVVYFMTPSRQEGRDANKFVPPAVRFLWGSFMFDGIMDGVNESLEYFSEDGKPLRASVSVNIARQDLQQHPAQSTGAGPENANTPGQQPLTPAPQGSSVQDMAARAGRPQDWKAIAAANGIENPRLLAPGTLLDLNAGATVGVSVGVSASVKIG